MREIIDARELDTMPMAKDFGNGLINATGCEVRFEGDEDDPANWWNEYADEEGNRYYGR